MAQNKTGTIITSFFIGGAIGSIAALLLTPKNGKEIRSGIQDGYNNMLSKAKIQGSRIADNAKSMAGDITSMVNDIMQKAETLRGVIANQAAGTYTGTIDMFENEVNKLKNALNAAIVAYKNSGRTTRENDIVVDNIFMEFDDEALPKQEGMGRRAPK